MNTKMIVVVLVVAVLSAGLTYTLIGKAPGASAKAEAPAEESAPAKIAGIETAPAVAGEGWDTVTLTGKVSVPPDRLVKISSRIEGKVVSARGTVGDAVRAGQVLAVVSSVDLAEARAQYRQAAARLAAARGNYERETQIAKLGATSVRPLEEARSESLTAQGELSDAKSELAQAKSELTREESELTQCKARLERAKELYSDQIVSKQDLETAEAEYKRDSAAVESARSKVAQAGARIDKTQSKLDIAKQYLSREERVYKGKVVDARALQTARAEVTAAQIDLQAAADKIRVLGASPSGTGDTVSVASPISGRIVARNTNVGEMASTSDALFTVANLSSVWIEADVYEKDLARVSKGQRAEIRVDAWPERVFAGTVGSIGDMLSPESRTAKVRCVVSNSEGLLRGEMFAKVSLITARRGSTVLVPREAVLDDAGKKVVFTPCAECPEDIKAGTNACGAYDKLQVTIGAAHGRLLEVLSGVEAGIPVVTTGAYQLKTAMGSGKLEAGCSGH